MPSTAPGVIVRSGRSSVDTMPVVAKSPATITARDSTTPGGASERGPSGVSSPAASGWPGAPRLSPHAARTRDETRTRATRMSVGPFGCEVERAAGQRKPGDVGQGHRNGGEVGARRRIERARDQLAVGQVADLEPDEHAGAEIGLDAGAGEHAARLGEQVGLIEVRRRLVLD